MSKTILVTGSAGYIGSILCKKLLDQGHKVSGLDIEGEFVHDTFYIEDYGDDLNFTYSEFDVVYHMGASSLLGPSVSDPLSYYLNNTGKTSTFIHKLIKGGFKGKFIFASSAAVYGDLGEHTASDRRETYHPINPYGRSKLQTEEQLQDLRIAYGFDYRAMRFFNVVGSYKGLGQQLQFPHILTSLCRAVYNGYSFTVNGTHFDTNDGSAIRDYVHVEDVVDCLIAASEVDKKDLLHESFNVCTGIGTSNIELVQQFKKYTGEKVDLHFGDARPGDPSYLVGQNYSAKNQFGFTPKHNLESIILSAWEYFKESHDSI